MRARVAWIVLVATSVVLSSAVGAGAPEDRPSGVAASDWVPISNSLGLVLTEARGASASTKDCACYKQGLCGSCGPIPPRIADPTLLLAPTSAAVRKAVEHAEAQEPIHGYLMVKQNGIWRRLVVSAD